MRGAMSKAAALAAAAIPLAALAAPGAGGWALHGERDGVTVWTADTPGSDVPTVKAVAEIDAPTGRVLGFITGPAMRFDGLKEMKEIDRCGEGCRYVYFRMGNWAITDRHYVVRMEWRAERVPGGISYTGVWSLPPERQPQSDDAVGVRGIAGSWRIEPVSGGRRTRATYVNHLDLGGSIPSFLYSLGFVRHAYDVLAKVRREA